MSSHRLQGKVSLVTGAASGIGRATAELFACNGAVVFVADVDFGGAESVVASIAEKGFTAQALTLNVADETAWRTAIDNVLATHGALDVLVNNAGISIVNPIEKCSFAEWRNVLSVNLDGTFLGTRAAIGAMKNGGSIVNVASVAGIAPGGGGAAAYCTSKAAIRMLSKAAAIECADSDSGIRVNVVSPGGVRTPIWDKQEFFQELVAEHGGVEQAFASMEGDAASQRFFTAEDVAETILYLASDASSQLTGVEIVLDRGHTG
jgi:NAD(P)-dependent dehydrogenase (short-subunit alcohol dehydrogenase family)